MSQLTDQPIQAQDSSATSERPNAQPPSDTRVAEASAKYLAETAGTATTVNPACPPGYKLTEVGVIPEDWEVVEFGYVLKEFRNGYAFSAEGYTTVGTPIITMAQIGLSGEFQIDLAKVNKWDSNQREALKDFWVRNGDLLIAMTDVTPGKNLIGQMAIAKLDDIALLNQRVGLIRLKTDIACSEYFHFFSCSPVWKTYCKGVASLGVQANIGTYDIRKAKVPLPSIQEQTAIANALSDMDALIGGLEKLIAKKQAIKTATMQQLLTGRTRLPQFALREDGTHKGYKQSELGEIPEDWEVVPFGDVLSIRHGKNQKIVESSNGNIPILATGGQIGWANQYLWNKPSVLIGRKGTIDKPRYVDSPFWTVDTLFYSEIKSCVEPKFIFYKFCMIDWMQYNEASGVPSLNASTIESVSISLPTKQEQTAIATILSDMDEEIQALQQRLEKTRQIKQGMMQELLTGRTRLVKPEQAA
ncbi:restriction endonuclease subunit S [Microbulbifer thermotolerans]|uniref:restriction endonuclease subunit S n=1 Tax=Microbulbifer thermotolerans TaxID=252514 RepID=UPI00224AF370|nr:restriction endonuclease subunit S [Microbulbifer thermotolerans]MCX2835182.1 restriction endonuclease subunit S [Microbulbifer thermotolerans]